MMNAKQMKPSEGPWRSVTNFHCIAPLKGCFVKSGDIILAEVSARNVGSQEICEANARLIAAAPELLTALKDALWALDNIAAITARTGITSTLDDPRPAMRAAIAKTEQE